MQLRIVFDFFPLSASGGRICPPFSHTSVRRVFQAMGKMKHIRGFRFAVQISPIPSGPTVLGPLVPLSHNQPVLLSPSNLEHVQG